MLSWNVMIIPTGTDRYSVVVFDPNTLNRIDLDGGPDQLGYDVTQLRKVAQERYGLHILDVLKRFTAADHRRALDTWGNAYNEMIQRRPRGVVSSAEVEKWAELCTKERAARAAYEEVAKRLEEGG